MKAAVYWNLHKDCFSIQSREKGSYGKVVAHAESVAVDLPEFVVRQAGRERVLKEGKKNVHAFVVGEVDYDSFYNLGHGTKITYNPYKFNSFVIADTKEQVGSPSVAIMGIVNNKPLIEVHYGNCSGSSNV